MKLTDFFLAQLEREAVLTRRALERVPEGHDTWKPHEKSMQFGYLATLVATILGWTEMIVQQDSFDMNPAGGQRFSPPILKTQTELLEALDKAVASARAALSGTTDEHLQGTWTLFSSGTVADAKPRYAMLADAVFSHLAHHRGQLTVYLRLNGAAVPAIYGPTADERF